MIHSCVFFCLVIVVHESLVCPEQLKCMLLFGKILQLLRILWFSSIFVFLNPFQQWLYDFEIHFFTLRTTERLICNYYRRFKRSLMLQKEKSCIKSQFLMGGGGGSISNTFSRRFISILLLVANVFMHGDILPSYTNIFCNSFGSDHTY